jgi:hypothetical protein
MPHENGSSQLPPPRAPPPSQQRSPLPPQATHVFIAQTLNGAVQSTSAPQQACPMPPQFPHELLAPHVPSEVPPAPVQAPAAATQVPRTQQPPVEQVSPSQHGSPLPPHAVQ